MDPRNSVTRVTCKATPEKPAASPPPPPRNPPPPLTVVLPTVFLHVHLQLPFGGLAIGVTVCRGGHRQTLIRPLKNGLVAEWATSLDTQWYPWARPSGWPFRAGWLSQRGQWDKGHPSPVSPVEYFSLHESLRDHCIMPPQVSKHHTNSFCLKMQPGPD